jgi:radical SAM superfamily enzyme YgiQ (UPF0313 family)
MVSDFPSPAPIAGEPSTAQKPVKKNLPDRSIVFGGPGATFMADHLFDACPELDFIVTSEGELTFLELADALTAKPGQENRDPSRD